MALSLANNDIVEITFNAKLDNQETISTFHYLVEGVSAINDGFAKLNEFVSLLRQPNNLFVAYQNVISDSLVDLQIYAQIIYPIRYRFTTDGLPTESGAVDALSFPSNVQASITRAAERAGRRYISHLSVPAVPITAIENSLLVEGYMTDMQFLATEVQRTYVTASAIEFHPVIFHPQFTPIFERIILAFPQPTSRVIRRRTVGLGS